MKQLVLVVSICAGAPRALAEPADDEPTAAEVATAPLPGQESGRIDRGEHDSTLRAIGRGILAVPKVVFETVFVPVRGPLWAYDRYKRDGSLERLSAEDTSTHGVTPTLSIDSFFGVTLGGRFVRRNALGSHEQLAMRLAFLGEVDEAMGVDFHSGNLLGRTTSLELNGDFAREPDQPYFGIGNNTDAIETRYRQQVVSATASVDVVAMPALHARVAGAFTDLSYGVADEGPAIETVYGPSMLTGFSGTRNLYGQVELAYDTRRITNALVQHGVLLEAFGGRVVQLEAGASYWRYGAEALYFIPLGLGRALATRVHLESVTGSVMDAAFSQLPELGGRRLLRGYAPGRFRDRVALVGSAEYFWDIGKFFLASLFVDTGRVYSSMGDLTLDDLRLGYGAALQLLIARQFIAGVSIASSIDGGVFVNVTFDPAFGSEGR